MNTKEKLKKHFSDNKKLYFGIAIGAVVAGTGVYIWNRDKTPTVVVGDYCTTETMINNVGGVVNNVHIPRRIHPGYITQCLETGVIYPSIRSAATAMKLPYGMLRRHFDGELSNVMGYTFSILGEAHAPI